MRRLVGVVLLALVGSGVAFGQAPPQNAAAAKAASVAEEIIALEQAWAKAEAAYDVAWFERNLADSFISTAATTGLTGTKGDFLNGVKTRSLKAESFTLSDMKVQSFGGTAVVTGTSHLVNATVDGKPYPAKTRWTDVWVRIKARWQCVASQSTEVK